MEEVGYNMYPSNASPCGQDLLVRPDTLRILGLVSWRDEVRRLLKAKGLRHRDIRHIFGAQTRGAVGHHLSGRNDTTVEQFFALANYLGVSAEDLFKADEPGYSDPDPVSCAGIEQLPPEERRHLQAVIRKFVASPAWDGKVERRKAPRPMGL